jgi:hypothetical protein
MTPLMTCLSWYLLELYVDHRPIAPLAEGHTERNGIAVDLTGSEQVNAEYTFFVEFA